MSNFKPMQHSYARKQPNIAIFVVLQQHLTASEPF